MAGVRENEANASASSVKRPGLGRRMTESVRQTRTGHAWPLPRSALPCRNWARMIAAALRSCPNFCDPLVVIACICPACGRFFSRNARLHGEQRVICCTIRAWHHDEPQRAARPNTYTHTTYNRPPASKSGLARPKENH